MKKKIFGLLSILLGLHISAFANSGSVINGSSYLKKAQYDSLQVNGNLKFTELSIKDAMVVNGNIQGRNLVCGTIKSNGSVDVDGLKAQSIESNGSFLGQNIAIAGAVKFNGGVDIKNGKLHDVQIESKKSTLIDTQVNGNIHINKTNKSWDFLNAGQSSAQIIELKGHTMVTGDVIFEGNGEVHLFAGAKIEGKVVNGRVVQK